MDKRTLEALPDSKYCSYSKDFLYNNWQNLLRASQKLKSQDVTRCYLFKHEVQCRAHNIVYMSGMAEHILYWGANKQVQETLTCRVSGESLRHKSLNS